MWMLMFDEPSISGCAAFGYARALHGPECRKLQRAEIAASAVKQR
jgi:hypothetical protein